MIPKQVFESTLRKSLGPILGFLDDSSVTEVLINGPNQVFVERAGRLSRVPASFPSHRSLLAALRVVAQYVGRSLDELNPILEARLPDGSRLEAVLPPVAPDGPAVAIRRFSKHELTIKKLIELGTLTEDAALALQAFVEAKRNIVVAGGTSSGKTSLLNALSSFVPATERIVVIEDAKELQLQREHIVHFEARPPDASGRGAVSIRDLFKTTLRMRPDRIVLGEIRGAEALDLIQAMTSGHGGCLTTVHATYPVDTLNRLETMALMAGVEMPLVALRSQLCSAIDLIVQAARSRDGKRCVTHITEVCGLDAQGSFSTNDLFVQTFTGLPADGTRQAKLAPTGVLPRCLQTILSGGLELPPAMYHAAENHQPTAWRNNP